MLEEALSYFKRLHASDQRAILALLGPDERITLERIIENTRSPPPAASAPTPDTRTYSRWLRRRLDEILSSADANVTPAAREALRTILLEGPA